VVAAVAVAEVVEGQRRQSSSASVALRSPVATAKAMTVATAKAAEVTGPQAAV